MAQLRGRLAPEFPSIAAAEFPALIAEYSRRARRSITEVHLHHTYVPDHHTFYDLKRRLGDEHSAGLELMQRMWRFHTQDQGWSDIAQHVTVMPDGAVWIGRHFDRPPASAEGFNGSEQRGPFMIETVGNFDNELPTDEQLDAVITVIASVQQAFKLKHQDVAFHSEMTKHKSCPGDLFKKRFPKDDLIGLIKDKKNTLAGKQSDNGDKRKRGVPFAASERKVIEAIDWMSGRQPGDDADMAREIASELAEGGAAMRAFTERGAGETARGERGTLSPEVLHRIRPHVINLAQGTYSTDGLIQTSKEDVEDLVNTHLKTWAGRLTAENATPRLMVYAHGGLVAEDVALMQVAGQFQWWLDNGVYPVFFVWETGLLETVMQLIGNLLPGRRVLERGRILDSLVEGLVHSVGQPFWSAMKVSAERASDSHERFGAFYLATLLADLVKDELEDLEVHVVGHSAGGIFHAFFLRELAERNIAVKTAQFMAPACTTELAKALILPNIDGAKIEHLSLYAMNDRTERADPTVPIYGKSLLYLVSRGFETDFGTPLFGLQKSVLDDPQLKQALGLGLAGGEHGNVVWSPTGEEAPPLLRSNSTTHGGFDNDADTMTAVMMRITDQSSSSGVSPFPAELRERGEPPLFGPLRLPPDVEALLRESARPPEPNGPPIVAPAASMAPSGAPPATQLSGRRHALCIGVDTYPTAPLYGCVNDARLWSETFAALGFTTELMLNDEATYDGLVDAFRQLISGARPGDMIALQYSGHGTHVPDLDGDEEDNEDEALVPIDFQGGRFLIDDDIREIFAGLADGVHMTTFFDCCHSGSNSRFAVGHTSAPTSVRERYMRLDERLRQAHRDFRQRQGAGRFVRAGGDQENMRHIQFSACQDYQTAKESEGHGWFTLAVTEIIGGRPGQATNTSVAEAIEQEFRRRNRRDQDPRLEGPVRLRSAAFLGGLAR